MNVFFKNLVVGFALSLSAVVAQAETIEFDEGSGGFFAVVKKGVSSFSGTWDFEVPSLSAANGSVTSSFSAVGVKDLVISSFYITGNGQTYLGRQTSTGSQEAWVIDAFNAAAGSYMLHVAGSVVPSIVGGKTTYGGGSFGGQLDLAAPVPEPETWGMMVGGLALVGALARRRKAANDKASFDGAKMAA